MPLLILTRDSILEYLSEVTVAPITTAIRQIHSEVFLSKADGMPRDCAINFDHIQTVSKMKTGALITTISSQQIRLVREAINFALHL